MEKEAAQFRVYSSEDHNPITRALHLRSKMRKIDLEGVDVVILGFLPQLITGPCIKKIAKAYKKNGNIVRIDNKENVVKKPDIVAEMFLSLYDTVVQDRHIFRDGGMFAALLKRMDGKTIEAADLVVTDTKANADYLAKLYGASREKFETLYLEADRKIYYGISSLEEDYPENETDNRNNEKTSKDAVVARSVLYFGTGLPLQGTDIVLEAFNIADKEISNQSDNNVRFTYVGSLGKIPKEEIKKAQLSDRIELIDWLPQARLARKVALADICIAGHFNPDIEKANRTIPGKAYIYEAMNKKMILGDTAANHEIFAEDYRHIFVERGDPQKLAETIIRLLQ